MTVQRFLPTPSPLTQPYWDATKRRELVMPHCRVCGKPHFYPRALCPFCRSRDLEWRPVSGKGVVHTFTVVHRAPSEAFADEVPYVVAVIALDEGPLMMSRVVGCDPGAVHVGDAVAVTFVARGGPEDVLLPCFEKAT